MRKSHSYAKFLFNVNFLFLNFLRSLKLSRESDQTWALNFTLFEIDRKFEVKKAELRPFSNVKVKFSTFSVLRLGSTFLTPTFCFFYMIFSKLQNLVYRSQEAI